MLEEYLRQQGVTDEESITAHTSLITHTIQSNPRFDPFVSYKVNPDNPNSFVPMMG